MKKDNHKEENKIIKSICLSVFSIVICIAIMSTATWAWFRPTVTAKGSIKATESFPEQSVAVLTMRFEEESATPTPSPEETKEPEEAPPSPAATEEPDTPTSVSGNR